MTETGDLPSRFLARDFKRPVRPNSSLTVVRFTLVIAYRFPNYNVGALQRVYT